MEVTRVAGNGAQAVSASPPPTQSADTGSARVNAAPPPPQVQAPAPAEMRQVGERPADRNEGGDVLRRAVREVNTSLETYGRHLGIRLHEATGRHVVTVYDSNTNEAVREIPPERVLDAHASLLELAGLFIDSRG